jgi:transposase
MNNLNYEGKKIYLGLDVHKSSWDLKVLTDHTTQKQIHLSPGTVESLEKYVKSNYPGGDYFCAYEAGYSGFWIHHQLEQRGINTLVVHAADVPTTDKEKRFKTDKIDCTKIAKALRGGFLTGIYVPDKQQQLDRSIVRQRYRCASDQRRIKNRIKAHLAFFGTQIEWEDGVSEKYWSHKMINNIEQFAQQKDDQALLGEIELLKQLRQAEARAMRRIRVLSQTDAYTNRVEWLRSIKGVGLLTAMVVLTEVGDIERFKDLDQLTSYVGIVPGSKSSGDMEQVKRIAKRGNKHLRTALILSAWMAIRNDAEMALNYENCRRRMISPKAIIKIARKLLSRMRYVLIHQCKLDYST